MKKYYLVCLTLFSFGLAAEVNLEQMSEIESRVDSMSLADLQDRRSSLIREEKQLAATQSSTQNPSTVKSVSNRLAEIRAELSLVQKALILLAGPAIIALTDEGYDDNIPPIISINGNNPATVELGATYSDAGATSLDNYRGATALVLTVLDEVTAVAPR
jgi:hypothetical protein